jgi:hypothetical protein
MVRIRLVLGPRRTNLTTASFLNARGRVSRKSLTIARLTRASLTASLLRIPKNALGTLSALYVPFRLITDAHWMHRSRFKRLGEKEANQRQYKSSCIASLIFRHLAPMTVIYEALMMRGCTPFCGLLLRIATKRNEPTAAESLDDVPWRHRTPYCAGNASSAILVALTSSSLSSRWDFIRALFPAPGPAKPAWV